MNGITEIRPVTIRVNGCFNGKYTINSLSMCATTILTTVISKPTSERVITDVGAKGLTAQKRLKGISAKKNHNN